MRQTPGACPPDGAVLTSCGRGGVGTNRNLVQSVVLGRGGSTPRAASGENVLGPESLDEEPCAESMHPAGELGPGLYRSNSEHFLSRLYSACCINTSFDPHGSLTRQTFSHLTYKKIEAQRG